MRSSVFALEPEPPRPLTLHELAQADRLGILTDVLLATRTRPTPCNGTLQHRGCQCPTCHTPPSVSRAQQKRAAAAQPWIPKRRAA